MHLTDNSWNLLILSVTFGQDCIRYHHKCRNSIIDSIHPLFPVRHEVVAAIKVVINNDEFQSNLHIHMETGQKIHLLRCIVFAYALRTYKPMCTSLPHVYFYVHNSNNRLVLKNTPICISHFSRRLELQHLPILTSIWGYNVWKHFWTNSTSWSYIAPITLMRMMTLLEKIGNGTVMKKTMKKILIKMNTPQRSKATMTTWTKVLLQWSQYKLSYSEKWKFWFWPFLGGNLSIVSTFDFWKRQFRFASLYKDVIPVYKPVIRPMMRILSPNIIAKWAFNCFRKLWLQPSKFVELSDGLSRVISRFGFWASSIDESCHNC